MPDSLAEVIEALATETKSGFQISKEDNEYTVGFEAEFWPYVGARRGPMLLKVCQEALELVRYQKTPAYRAKAKAAVTASNRRPGA